MVMTEENASKSQFVDALRVYLENAGLGDAEPIHTAPESTAFGDTAAIFRIGPLLLRITRERGQRFVDIAAQREPMKFHQFDDIDIAMGWRSIDDVLAKREPEPIETVLHRLRANLDVLMDAFSGDRERFTRARVEKAAYERGQAFMARLRREQ